MKNLLEYSNKARAALAFYRDEIQRGKKLSVTISNGNSKTGRVASVSSLPGTAAACAGTCPGTCSKTCMIDNCYAIKLANLRPSVLNSWAKNTALLLYRPEKYWADVEHAIMFARYFRFHVSGDIFGLPYLENMIKLARKYPDCKLLAFTKAFTTVNIWIKNNGPLPENLKILFSGWTGLTVNNPYNLPETIVINRGENVPDNVLLCGGNCENCACRGVGCWTVQNGQTIGFHKH